VVLRAQASAVRVAEWRSKGVLHFEKPGTNKTPRLRSRSSAGVSRHNTTEEAEVSLPPLSRTPRLDDATADAGGGGMGRSSRVESMLRSGSGVSPGSDGGHVSSSSYSSGSAGSAALRSGDNGTRLEPLQVVLLTDEPARKSRARRARSRARKPAVAGVGVGASAYGAPWQQLVTMSGRMWVGARYVLTNTSTVIVRFPATLSRVACAASVATMAHVPLCVSGSQRRCGRAPVSLTFARRPR
jgi:hypothetical protein